MQSLVLFDNMVASFLGWQEQKGKVKSNYPDFSNFAFHLATCFQIYTKKYIVHHPQDLARRLWDTGTFHDPPKSSYPQVFLPKW